MNKHMIRKQSLFGSKSFRAKCCKIVVLFFLQAFGEMNLQLRGYGRPDQVYASEARTSQLPAWVLLCLHAPLVLGGCRHTPPRCPPLQEAAPGAGMGKEPCTQARLREEHM